MSEPEGVLLVDKPAGMTSHDVVDVVRKRLGTRKVGHAGTLDPMATGLLVLGVGRGTRLLRFLGALPKTYEGTARLGVETDDARRRRRGHGRTAGDGHGVRHPRRDVVAARGFPPGAAGVLGGEGRRPQAVRGGAARRGPRGAGPPDPRRRVRADRAARTRRGVPGHVLRRHLRAGAPGGCRRRARERSAPHASSSHGDRRAAGDRGGRAFDWWRRRCRWSGRSRTSRVWS